MLLELDGISPTLSSFSLNMQAVNASNSDYYSFIDVVRFRVRQLAAQDNSSDEPRVNELKLKRLPFIGNLRKNVLKLLREAFCAAKSHIPELQICSRKDLFESVSQNKNLQDFLAQSDVRRGIKTTSIYSSVQHMCQSNANGGNISWKEVQDVVFPDEDTKRPIFRHSPLNVPIFSNPNIKSSSSTVHEMEVDVVTHRIYLLMLSGELHVWDAATLGTKPFLICPVVTRECSPVKVGIQSGSISQCIDDQCIIKAMLTMTPRAKILRTCSRTGVLIVNSTLGDRCLRVFEPVSLHRLHRIRLDLPPSPWFALGLFDEEEKNSSGRTATVAQQQEQQQQQHFPRHATMHWTSACSVLDFCYQAAQEVAVCIISERRTILAYCCVTGLALASLPGHTTFPSCILYIPSQEHVITGDADRSIRVWDLESSFLSCLEHKWSPVKRKFMSQIILEGGIVSSRVDFVQHAEQNPVQSARHKQRNIKSSSSTTQHHSLPESQILMIFREALLKNYEKCKRGWKIGRVTSVIDVSEIWPSASGDSKTDKKQYVLEILMEGDNEIILLDPSLNDIQLLSDDETQESMADHQQQQHFEYGSSCFKVGTRLNIRWKKFTKVRGKDETVCLACRALFKGYGSTCTVKDFISAVLSLDGAPTEAQLFSIANLFIEKKTGHRRAAIVL